VIERRDLASLGAVAVVGVGARTALGGDAPSTACAARAGLGNVDERAHLRARRTGAPITVALDAGLDPRVAVGVRLQVLATAAALEAVDAAAGAADGLPLGLVCAMAPDRPGLDARARRAVVQAVAANLGPRVSRAHCQILATGHDGGISGIFHAARMVNRREVGACLVGGVESCADLRFLDWLDGQGRLKNEERPHGIFPGEAAAFLVVLPAHAVPKEDDARHPWIASVAHGDEPSPWYTGRPSLARGLTAAIAGVFAPPALRALRADVVYADLNGEPWRADEWAAAYLRTAENHGEPLHMRHPADCWGDVGAASAPLFMAMAALELAHPRMRSRSALVFTASDVRPGRAAGFMLTERGGA
jgi:3-oxoacyl-[acyl-carrier-protein] synthase-1